MSVQWAFPVSQQTGGTAELLDFWGINNSYMLGAQWKELL